MVALVQRWIVAAAVVAVIGGAFAGYEDPRWSGEQVRIAKEAQERAAAKKLTEATAAAAAVAKRKADEETKARAEEEARRQQEERIAAKKRSDEEARLKARTESELAFIAEAKRKSEDEARRTADETRRAERALEEKAQRTAQAERDAQEGDRYFYGRGVAKDYGKGRDLYEKSATLGNGQAMDGLGREYQNGYLVSQRTTAKRGNGMRRGLQRATPPP